MECQCGGVVTDTTYLPVKQDFEKFQRRQQTHICGACGRRMVKVYNNDTGDLVSVVSGHDGEVARELRLVK